LSSSSPRPGSWWAPSSKHAKRTAAGTAAIVLALALITWSVWASPSNPVTTAVHHALGVSAASDSSSADAAQYKKQLAAAQEQIYKLEGQLKSVSASKASRGDQVTALKAEIASLQTALGKAKAQYTGLKSAASGSGSSGSGSSGSGGSGSGSTSASGSHFGSSGSGSSGSGSSGSGGTAPGNGSGTSNGGGTPSITVPTKAELVDPTSRYYGLYTQQSPFNWADYDAISQKVGEASNLDGYFQGFDQTFNASAVQRSWANGRLPMMTWETNPATTGNNAPYVAGYTNQDIISGKFDAYLKQYADAVKANGQPMVIRLDHEMNGNWYNWSENIKSVSADEQNATGSYVAMWQHVWTVFQNEGANADVIWDWSPTRIDALGNPAYQTEDYLKEYYPGSQYVDWVGMSGYYRDATTTPSFDTTFGRTLAQIRDIAPGKKILLGEVGATETGGSVSNAQKPAWITSFFDALALPANDDIVGFAYFDEVATTITDGQRSTNDWRIDSRSDSLQAFIDGISRKDIGYNLQKVAAS
jgi:beta-mannanase